MSTTKTTEPFDARALARELASELGMHGEDDFDTHGPTLTAALTRAFTAGRASLSGRLWADREALVEKMSAAFEEKFETFGSLAGLRAALATVEHHLGVSREAADSEAAALRQRVEVLEGAAWTRGVQQALNVVRSAQVDADKTAAEASSSGNDEDYEYAEHAFSMCLRIAREINALQPPAPTGGDGGQPPGVSREGTGEGGKSARWRVGRKLGRTLYRDDECVGMLDTPELGAEVVAALNGAAPTPAVPGGAGRGTEGLTIREAQRNQPWTVPYSREVTKAESLLPHILASHCVLHAAKTMGKLAAVFEALDHVNEPTPTQAQLATVRDMSADLFTEALRFANLYGFDLEAELLRRRSEKNLPGPKPGSGTTGEPVTRGDK